MNGQASFRGQPLLLLAMVVIGWSAVRVAAWERVEPDRQELAHFADNTVAESQAPMRSATSTKVAEPAKKGALAGTKPATATAGPIVRLKLEPSRPFDEPRPLADPTPAPALDAARPMLPAWDEADAALKDLRVEPTPVRRAIGHNLLLAAGLSQMEIPPEIAAHMEAAQAELALGLAGANDATPAAATASPAFESLRNTAGQRRLSGDAWLYLRDGSSAVQPGLQPSYGRSQAGAVIRFKLAPASPYQPQAYARATGAVEGPKEEDLAVGLSGRPVPEIPVRVAAELRATRNEFGSDLRPAAFAVTELAPLTLPLGTRAQAYVAGGYVGGDFKTGFIEGQARVEKLFAREEDTEFTAGAGAWGGAQKDAARLDVGPTAAVSFRLGETRSRVAVDYRIRVAGDAEPASGAALTLSAGF